jgi:hypothetical protein
VHHSLKKGLPWIRPPALADACGIGSNANLGAVRHRHRSAVE